MHERMLYEYAVVRLVPRVDREEFLNVGVLLYCRKQRYADLLYHLDEHRCFALYGEMDLIQIKKHLDSMKVICYGLPEGGRIAQLEQAERFRWLTANRSTIIQCSPVHPGICQDAISTHRELLHRLVL